MIAPHQPTESAAPATLPASGGSAVTPRAVVFGFLCALLVCGVTPYNDYLVAATYLSGNFFPIGALAAVLILTLLVNPLLIALGRRRRMFQPGEIVTVWAMVITAAGIPSSGLMRYLIPHIVAPHYYETGQNHWDSLFLAHLPSYLFVSDPFAVRTFFEGCTGARQSPGARGPCRSAAGACLPAAYF